MMQRMRELAVQAASGTMSSTDRTALNTEYQALNDQILRLLETPSGMVQTFLMIQQELLVLSTFMLGANASQTSHAT